MPFDQLSGPNNFRILGSLTVIQDPSGNAGNVNIDGIMTVSGNTHLMGNNTISGNNTIAGNNVISGNNTIAGNNVISGNNTVSGTVTDLGPLIASGGVSIPAGGLQYQLISGSENAPLSTTSSQLLANSGTLNMLNQLARGHTLYISCTDTSATNITLAPTSSASSGGKFQNGVEITVINLAPSGTNVIIPSGGAGPYATSPATISGGAAARFIYVAALQTWIHVV